MSALRVALLLLLACFNVASWAEGSVSPSSQPTYRITSDGITRTATSASAVCSAWTGAFQTYLSSLNALNHYTVNSTGSTESTCSYQYTFFQCNGNTGECGTPSSPTSSSVSIFKENVSVCPQNSSGTVPSCTCNAGYQPEQSATACVAACTVGTTFSGGVGVVGNYAMDASKLYCAGDCAYVQNGLKDVKPVVVGGVTQYWGSVEMKATGQRCSDNGVTAPQPPAAASQPPANTCGANQYGGTIAYAGGSEVFKCFDKTTGEEKASVPLPAASQPVNGSEKTETKVTDNGDGSKTTTTTTTSSSGAVRTVTVTCDAAGNCSSTTTSAGGLGQAGNGGSGGEDSCPEGTDKVACMNLGSGDGGPGGGGDELGNEEKHLSITPDGGWGTAGACPSDKVLNLHFVTLTVPFTLLCTAGDMARPIVLAVAWLSAIVGFVGLSKRD